MKRLLLILILTFSFQTLSKADDIRDFEIEGMSLYDSALKHFKKWELKDLENGYKSDNYSTATIYSSKFIQYEALQISFKTGDSNYKILDITGSISMNYKSCINKLDYFENEFSKMFTKANKEKNDNYPHPADQSEESRITDIYWYFTSGDIIIAQCYNWDSKMGRTLKYKDELKITVGSKEFDDFIINEAYK